MNRGFTLVELIVVISVIAILAGVVTPAVGVILEEAKKTRAIADVDTLKKAVLMFNTKVKNFPYLTLSGALVNYAYANAFTQYTNLNTQLMNQTTMSTRILSTPWSTTGYYWYYMNTRDFTRANVVLGHYGVNQTNNGVWSSTVWQNGTTAPSDDYYTILQ